MAADWTANANSSNWNNAMLTASEKQQLEEQGYLSFPGFLTPAQVEQFNARVEQLAKGLADFTESELAQLAVAAPLIERLAYHL